MNRQDLVHILKDELNSVERKLNKTQGLHAAARIGSGAAAGLMLATMTTRIPVFIGIVLSGALLNIAVTQLMSWRR